MFITAAENPGLKQQTPSTKPEQSPPPKVDQTLRAELRPTALGMTGEKSKRSEGEAEAKVKRRKRREGEGEVEAEGEAEEEEVEELNAVEQQA